jgi:hypothetical protein
MGEGLTGLLLKHKSPGGKIKGFLATILGDPSFDFSSPIFKPIK